MTLRQETINAGERLMQAVAEMEAALADDSGATDYLRRLYTGFRAMAGAWDEDIANAVIDAIRDQAEEAIRAAIEDLIRN